MSRAEVRQRRPAIAALEGPRGGKPAPAHSAGHTRTAENLHGMLSCHTPSHNRAAMRCSDNGAWAHVSQQQQMLMKR